MITDDQVNELIRKLGMSFGCAKPETVIDEMVTRFLSWRLPEDFSPDSGVSFTPLDNPNLWPQGTNLFNALQAREMIMHMLGSGEQE